MHRLLQTSSKRPKLTLPSTPQAFLSFRNYLDNGEGRSHAERHPRCRSPGRFERSQWLLERDHRCTSHCETKLWHHLQGYVGVIPSFGQFCMHSTGKNMSSFTIMSASLSIGNANRSVTLVLLLYFPCTPDLIVPQEFRHG